MPTNDNYPAMPGPTLSQSDPHGHAALLLVESLIHGLCENGTLSAAQAVEIPRAPICSARFRVEEVNTTYTFSTVSPGTGKPARELIIRGQ